VNSIRSLFLANCEVVAHAVADQRVVDAWDRPSVLEDQTVGSVVAHVVRGSWIVDDFLDQEPPSGPVTFASAPDYFATLLDAATPELHAGIRERGAEGAAHGSEHLVDEIATKLESLRERLANEPQDRLVTVFGGVMRLDDYLGTRIIEQVVHLDDLARSIGIDPWENASGADALALTFGAEIGCLRFGGPAMVRALFRSANPGVPSPLPVVQDQVGS